MLSGAEAEKVAEARKMYQKLSDLCNTKHKKKTIPVLIADLILAKKKKPMPPSMQPLPRKRHRAGADRSAAQ